MKTNTNSSLAVVIPHHNQTDYLINIIALINDQTCQPNQIIIVDDASPEPDFAPINDLCSSRKNMGNIELVRLEKKSGPNTAITTGLQKTTAQFVAVIACDDWISPNFFKESIEQLTKFPKAAFCFSDPSTFQQIDHKKKFNLYLSQKPAFFSPDDFVKIWSRISFTFPTNSVVYRREKLNSIGNFWASMEIYADWFACHVLALEFGACYIPKNQTSLFESSTSYSQSFSKKRRQRASFFDVTLSCLSEKHPLIASKLSQIGIVPEYNMFFLSIVLQHKVFCTKNVIVKIITRHMWAFVRPLMTRQLRLACRSFFTPRTKWH